jgi:hypothetical protein
MLCRKKSLWHVRCFLYRFPKTEYRNLNKQMMKSWTIITALALLMATECVRATFIYRYAWTPIDSLSEGALKPTPFGTPGSGFIDLSAPTGDVAGAPSTAISDLQFTGFAAKGEGVLPDIPATTYSLPNALSSPSTRLTWNAEKITFMNGVTLSNPSAPGMSSQISDADVQTVFPLAYQFNEMSLDGKWLFQGKLDPNRVSESGGNALIFALSAVAVAMMRLAATRPKAHKAR